MSMSEDQSLLREGKSSQSFCSKYKAHFIIGTIAILLWVGSCLLLYFTLRPQTLSVQTIKTKLAPSPLGPYSAGRSYGDLVFVAGQIGIDPATDHIESDDISLQTIQALKNLKNVVEAGGSNMNNILMTTIYLNDEFVENFKKVNVEYEKFFNNDSYPARATMAVKQLPLKYDKQALVEISAIAVKA